MILHHDKRFFEETLRAASQHSGINLVFVEKDYWITFVLSQLAKSTYAEQCVFKGGTSLSKGYGLINRFSEDVDIAIIDERSKSGNEVKAIIRAVEKEMTSGLLEKNVDGVSSKGSRFRKSVFEYSSIDKRNAANKLIVEVNSFANPYPFQKILIHSFVHDFLMQSGNETYSEKYNLQPFVVNILNKEQTLLEKLVSLIRCSFDENPVQSIASKIRHFYDLYFLVNDPECEVFVQSEQFKMKFNEILLHDKKLFGNPTGWQNKETTESPLIADFEMLWKQLKDKYNTELSALVYGDVPDEKIVARNFQLLINSIR
ncbi:MAG: nucleotidyl transferase AbiEii/AbiGii toxin family protein [Ignavibacteria bacterium]|nr:nucleotidyl transferase AbiEii/AbiGii toxin family protein [Ignavibacteria bacterium]